MVDITAWMNDFLQNLNHTFENRVWFAVFSQVKTIS